MAGVRNRPESNGKYKGWFIDYTGRKRHRVGTRKKSATLRIMQRLEDEQRHIRLGYAPVPTSNTHALSAAA